MLGARPAGRLRDASPGKDAMIIVMQDGDVVADRRDDGSYIIRRWRARDGALLPIDGHEDSFDEEEMYRRLNLLRATGDTYVRDQPMSARLVQP